MGIGIEIVIYMPHGGGLICHVGQAHEGTPIENGLNVTLFIHLVKSCLIAAFSKIPKSV
jgi:hypothetical protein